MCLYDGARRGTDGAWVPVPCSEDWSLGSQGTLQVGPGGQVQAGGFDAVMYYGLFLSLTRLGLGG